jgi:hypothetical protein
MSFEARDRTHVRAAPPLPLLQPMEVGELLDEAFDLYKKNFRLFVTIAVLCVVPLSVIQLATPQASGWQFGVVAMSYLAGMVTNCALTHAALERHLGRQTSVAAAYRLGASRFLRLFSGYLIYGLAMLGGLIALVIPGLIVFLWSLLLVSIVTVENRGGLAAFRRARELSTGNLWRVFFVALGLVLVVLVFAFVLVGLAGIVEIMLGYNPSEPVDRLSTAALVVRAVATVISDLFGAAWSPLIATAPLLAYLDLRIRREAYDLELLTTAVEQRVAAARPPLALPRPTGP